MLHWYLFNIFEIIVGIVFFVAAIKFLVKKKHHKTYLYFGIMYLFMSILSIIALLISVHVSGIMSKI